MNYCKHIRYIEEYTPAGRICWIEYEQKTKTAKHQVNSRAEADSLIPVLIANVDHWINDEKEEK